MRNLALLLFASLLPILAGAQVGLETLGKRTVPTGYSYMGITGTPNADPNVWTPIYLSSTAGVPLNYQGTLDVYMVPHGGTGEFMITSSTTPPVNQGFPVAQSQTSRTLTPLNADQTLWIRGGGFWDILIGYMKTLIP